MLAIFAATILIFGEAFVGQSAAGARLNRLRFSGRCCSCAGASWAVRRGVPDFLLARRSCCSGGSSERDSPDSSDVRRAARGSPESVCCSSRRLGSFAARTHTGTWVSCARVGHSRNGPREQVSARALSFVTLELGIGVRSSWQSFLEFERRGWKFDFLAVLGRTPMFFYLLHIPVLALTAEALGVSQRLGLAATFGFAAPGDARPLPALQTLQHASKRRICPNGLARCCLERRDSGSRRRRPSSGRGRRWPVPSRDLVS